MIDYGALPPEVNSTRMYTGAGAGPLLAAAAAWDVLAQELSLTAAAVEMNIADLTSGPWSGPSATAMAAAALPFTTWFKTTAAQAEQSAMQAKAAAAAFEAAFAMTVPPQMVFANRAQLMTLVATNFFGQNTPAIAATEAHYAAMWAQDAAAMYTYSVGSAAATQLTEFTAPPQTTNPGGTAEQAAAVGQSVANATATNVAQPLAEAGSGAGAGAGATTPTAPVATTPIPPGITYLLSEWTAINRLLNSGYSPASLGAATGAELESWEHSARGYTGVRDILAEATKVTEAPAKAGTAAARTPGFNPATPSAALGRGMQVGALSVPQSWPTTPSPGAQPATLASSRMAAAAESAGMSRGSMAGMSGLAALPAAANANANSGPTGFRFVPRYGYRHRVMNRPPSAG